MNSLIFIVIQSDSDSAYPDYQDQMCPATCQILHSSNSIDREASESDFQVLFLVFIILCLEYPIPLNIFIVFMIHHPVFCDLMNK
jgi:hypothetical protein